MQTSRLRDLYCWSGPYFSRPITRSDLIGDEMPLFIHSRCLGRCCRVRSCPEITHFSSPTAPVTTITNDHNQAISLPAHPQFILNRIKPPHPSTAAYDSQSHINPHPPHPSPKPVPTYHSPTPAPTPLTISPSPPPANAQERPGTVEKAKRKGQRRLKFKILAEPV